MPKNSRKEVDAMPDRLYRMLIALLVIVIATATWSSCASAAVKRKDFKRSNGTLMYVYTYSLNVYEKPNTDSNIVEQVGFAKRIMRFATQKGWAQVVTTNHNLGYCNLEQLTSTDPNKYDTTVYGAHDQAPVYLRPSVSSPLIGHLDTNEKARMVAMTPKGDWLRVEQRGYYGYVQKPRVDYVKWEEGRDAWLAAESAPVYYDPHIASVITTLYFGQGFTLLTTDGQWAKIRNRSGLVAYIAADVVTTVNPNSMSSTVYAQVSGSYMFRGSSSESGRASVEMNQQMTLIAVDDTQFWARVKYNGEYFYVPYICLGTQPRLDGYKQVMSRMGINIREGTKKSADVVATVPTGTKLLLLAASGHFAKVSTLPDANGNRFTGYIEIQYLI